MSGKSVLAPPYDFDSLNKFISDESIKPNGIKISFMSAQDSKFFNGFSPDEINRDKEKWTDIFNNFIHKLKNITGLPPVSWKSNFY